MKAMRTMLRAAVICFLLAVLAGFLGLVGWTIGLAMAARVFFFSFLILFAAAVAARLYSGQGQG